MKTAHWKMIMPRRMPRHNVWMIIHVELGKGICSCSMVQVLSAVHSALPRLEKQHDQKHVEKKHMKNRASCEVPCVSCPCQVPEFAPGNAKRCCHLPTLCGWTNEWRRLAAVRKMRPERSVAKALGPSKLQRPRERRCDNARGWWVWHTQCSNHLGHRLKTLHHTKTKHYMLKASMK